MSTQSFIVLEAAAQADFDLACAELAASRPSVKPSFGAAAPGVVCAAEVRDRQTAQQAVLAALAGAHLVVAATAPREVIDMLCEDLRRLGRLDHRFSPRQQAGSELSPAERALVERLLAGDSLGQAAVALHISRRTADRRLASARRALGAATTAEALAVAVSRGLRPPA